MADLTVALMAGKKDLSLVDLMIVWKDIQMVRPKE